MPDASIKINQNERISIEIQNNSPQELSSQSIYLERNTLETIETTMLVSKKGPTDISKVLGSIPG
jgi:hypothetical protein